MSKQKMSSVVPFFNKKRNIIILGILLLIVVSSTTVFLFLNDAEGCIVTGTLYIDSLPAPTGVSVKIVFPVGDARDPDGTDEMGRYRIDVSNFNGETGTFFISFNGTTYIPKNQSFEYFEFTATDGSHITSIDLFVYVLHQDGEDDTSDDDTTDDTSDDDTTDDTSDDDTTDDTTEDDDDESISSLLMHVYVWDNKTAAWTDEIGAEKGKIVFYKIQIDYTGKNYIKDILISDQSNSGLDFVGNATINGTIKNPEFFLTMNTIHWNLSDIKMNDSMIILFNCTLNGTGSLVSNITVNAKENTSKTFNLTDSATVNVYGDLEIEKQVWNNRTLMWVDEYSADVGNIARFKISLLYNGSFTVDDVVIKDFLPEGLDYVGNATINGTTIDPIVDTKNHTLQWNLDMIAFHEIIAIEYDTNITLNQTFTNTVMVLGEESIGKSFNKTNSAIVTGEALKQILCVKQVRHSDGSWVKKIDAYVGTTASFKITLFNNGNQSFYNLNILDDLPDSLTYVIDSSMILYGNESFNTEPDSNDSTNQLLWSNINSVIHDYLNVGENISIIFNTTIVSEGLLMNQVDVTSTICDECEPLDISDTAFVNATMPIPQLNVDSGGPYTQRPGVPVILSASATGGTPPYQYLWDLNDDGLFDDGNTSEIVIQWDTDGNYSIHAKVIDNVNDTDTDTTYVNISIPPLMVDAGGPYTQFAGDVIEFHGSATGGITGYSWHWDFGDGNTSTQQNPAYIYMNPGSYIATLTVNDSINHSKNDTALIMVKERDATPPEIDVDDPISALYINGRAVFPFFVPLVFGELQINITAVDAETSVEKIELHINDDLIGTWYDSSIQWTWSERAFGRFRLNIAAYDEAGNWNELELIVWKFF